MDNNSPQESSRAHAAQVTDTMSKIITQLGMSRRHGERREGARLPDRKTLEGMGPQVSKLMEDTNDCLASAARNLAIKGTIIMDPRQFETLAMAGVNEEDLAVLANLNGLTFSHRVSQIRERIQAIAMVPIPQDGKVNWTQWIFEQRDVLPPVHPYPWQDDPLGETLDRICATIAHRAWDDLPDCRFVARQLAQGQEPVRATEFATTLMECYASVGAIDPKISTTTLWTHRTRESPGTPLAEAHQYPYPTTPSTIKKTLADALGDQHPYLIDMGELSDLSAMARDMPDPESLYLNHQGSVWYHKQGSSHHLIHRFLQADEPEDRSQWPERQSIMAPEADFTEGEMYLALIATPEAPYPTGGNANSITLLSPVAATAWLNRTTPQQARARLRNEPDPAAPDATCPAAAECPTACAYVQRAGLLRHTLFDDGKYEDCRFRQFRAMHGAKPPEARNELALKMAERINERVNTTPVQDGRDDGRIPDDEKHKTRQPKNDQPRQTALF